MLPKMFKVVEKVIGRPMRKVSANIQLRYFRRLCTGMTILFKHAKSTRNVCGSLEKLARIAESGEVLGAERFLWLKSVPVHEVFRRNSLLAFRLHFNQFDNAAHTATSEELITSRQELFGSNTHERLRNELHGRDKIGRASCRERVQISVADAEG